MWLILSKYVGFCRTSLATSGPFPAAFYELRIGLFVAESGFRAAAVLDGKNPLIRVKNRRLASSRFNLSGSPASCRLFQPWPKGISRRASHELGSLHDFR